MPSALSTERRATLLAGVLLAAIAPQAHASDYLYELDSARVVGNASGGAGCFEGFDGGLDGWTQLYGDPMASGGLVVFQGPGELDDALRTFYDLGLERDALRASSACQLTGGAGDAEVTTEWVNHLPVPPGGSYGHQIAYAVSPTLVEAVMVSVINFHQAVAAEFGIEPGLYVTQSKVLFDATDPNALVLAAPIESQAVAISQTQLFAATGQRIYLRLSYDEVSATTVASFSLDGEASYQSPFTPVSSVISSTLPGVFDVNGVAITPDTTTVPALSPRGGVLLAGLLLAAALGARRIRLGAS